MALKKPFTVQVRNEQKTEMFLVTVLGEGEGVQGKRQEQLPRGQHGPEERQREFGKQNWLINSNPSFCPGDVTQPFWALVSLFIK